MNSKKPSSAVRGPDLDRLLEAELETMVRDGYLISPISIPALTKRLGLSSRSTLRTPARKGKIEQALSRQKILAGVSEGAKQGRKSLQEKIECLERANTQLQREIDHQLELMCRVVANATAKGWDVEYLLSPLRKNGRELVNS